MAREKIIGARIHVVMPKRLIDELAALSDETGVNTSEHIRRAVDFYITNVVSKLYAQRRGRHGGK